MTSDLDSFEAQLLHDLKTRIAARSLEEPISQAVPSVRRWRRTAVAAAAAAVATAAAVIVPGVVAGPAYAVDEGPSGTITVKVNRLENAAGLRRALAKHGVKADVQYLGREMQCTAGRYRPADSASHSATSFTVGTDRIVVELDRRDVSHGETVVIAASRITNGVHGEVGIADGPVRDCQPIQLAPTDG